MAFQGRLSVLAAYALVCALVTFSLAAERTPAIGRITIETQRAESISAMNSLAMPQGRLMVPMKTPKATDLGTDTEATEIATIKLPRMPISPKVLRRPEMPAVGPLMGASHHSAVVGREEHEGPKARRGGDDHRGVQR